MKEKINKRRDVRKYSKQNRRSHINCSRSNNRCINYISYY